MRQYLSVVLSLSLLTALSQTARAAELSNDQDGGGADILVYTANRSSVPRSHTGNAITVLDELAIKSSQAISVSELLITTPGVSMSRNGGIGTTTGLRIRGAETDQTVVIIDGVKLNDPASAGGGFDFSSLLVGDIANIEILRGPQSTLWGGQAIGGVVNIQTADANSAFGGNIDGEIGTRSTGQARLGLGGKTDRLSWRIAGSLFTTGGISSFDKTFGGKERDGFHEGAVSGRLRYDISPSVQLDLRGMYIDSQTHFDGFPAPNYALADDPEYGIVRQYVDYTGVNFKLFGGALTNRIALQLTQTERTNYDPSQSYQTSFLATGRNQRVEYQGTWLIADGYQAVFGAESEHPTMKSSSPSTFNPRPAPIIGHADQDSGYVQVQGNVLPGLTVTAGGRFDHHETFGDHGTAQTSLAYTPDAGQTVLRAGFGQGFKPPTLYQLFSPYGNQKLSPEEADGFDAGIERRLFGDRASVGLTYFNRVSRNLIGFFSCFGSSDPQCRTQPGGFYRNTNKAESSGIEAEANAKITSQWTVAANFTHTDATDRSTGSSTFGKTLALRPKDIGTVTMTYLWPFDLSTGVSVHFAGSSFDDAANRTRLAGYTLVDLRASLPVTRDIELYARIENIADKHYETVYRYGTLGRGGALGVRMQF